METILSKKWTDHCPQEENLPGAIFNNQSSLRKARKFRTLPKPSGWQVGNMNPAMTPTEQFTPSPLIGARVVLRPFQETDITEGYLGWLNDPEVTQYLEVGKAPVTLLEVRKYVERVAEHVIQFAW